MLNFSSDDKYTALGDEARDNRRWTEAAEFYQRALNLQPHNPPIWVQYGHALKESGRLAEAEAAYRNSLTYAPDVADTYLQLGHVLKLQGKTEEMREAYLEAFIHDPNLPDPIDELARAGWSDAELMELRYQLAPERSLVPDPVRLRASNSKEKIARDCGDAKLKLSVDRPTNDGARVTLPVRSRLLIEGWAIAYNGVALVSARIDGVTVGTANYGLRRTDIRDAYPDWPGSLMSGFALPVQSKHLTPGEHKLEIVLRSHDDKVISTTLDFLVESGDPWSLRRKIGHSEVAVLESILKGSRRRASIVLLIDVADTTQVQATRVTLKCLRTQAYPDWTLRIHCRPRDAELLKSVSGEFIQIAGKVEVIAEALESETLAGLGRDGDLIGLLTPGDMLACDSLLQVAVSAALHEDADFFYGDETRISPVSGYREPFFKPRWSPDLLLSTNYIGRFWCAIPELLTGITLEEWRIYGEYDVVLRVTEAARLVQHVPVILCERAQVAIDDPNQEKIALYRALERRGIQGEVINGELEGYYRLTRSTQADTLVSVIIPTGGNVVLLEKCMAGLLERTNHRNLDVILLHNATTRKEAFSYFETLKNDSRVRIIDSNSGFNFSRICNLGAGHARGDYLLFLNDDIEVTSGDWVDCMLEHAQRREVGIVGARLLYPSGNIQHAGIFWVEGQLGGRHAFRHSASDDPGYFGLAQTTRNVLAVTGACIMLRRAWFEQIGRFDERHTIVNNDVDLSLRSWRHGKAVVYEPRVTLIHHELASRQDLPDMYDSKAFWAEWGSLIQAGDPFYHPNLARDLDDYTPDAEPSRRRYAAGPIYSHDDIQRVLLVKLDHLGDFVTAVPAIERLKAEFPKAEFHLLAPIASGLLAGSLLGGLKSIIPFDFFHTRSAEGVRPGSDEEKERLRQILAAYDFDLAVDLRKHLDTREILLLTGARWLAGYDRDSRFPWLDIALEWECDTRLVRKRSHVTDDLLRLVEAVVIAARPALPVLEVREGRRGNYNISGKPLVCIHPGVGAPARQWPASHFATLVDLLANNHDVEIVLIGSEAEAELADGVLEKVTRLDAVRSLAGLVPLTDLPAMLASAVLFVGNNSGPKHLAAGLGVPTVGIHSGAVEVAEWGPVGPNAVALQRDMVCGPCYIAHVDQCPRGLACLTELSPGVVYAACRDMLAGVAPARAQSDIRQVKAWHDHSNFIRS